MYFIYKKVGLLCPMKGMTYSKVERFVGGRGMVRQVLPRFSILVCDTYFQNWLALLDAPVFCHWYAVKNEDWNVVMFNILRSFYLKGFF